MVWVILTSWNKKEGFLEENSRVFEHFGVVKICLKFRHDSCQLGTGNMMAFSPNKSAQVSKYALNLARQSEFKLFVDVDLVCHRTPIFNFPVDTTTISI